MCGHGGGDVGGGSDAEGGGRGQGLRYIGGSLMDGAKGVCV